jgi:type IV pilus assembly protein PilN
MIRINLLKPEKKEMRKEPTLPSEEVRAKKRPALGGYFILLLIIIVAALFFFQKKGLDREKNLLAQAQVEKSKLQYVIAKLDEVEQRKASLVERINLITALKSQQQIVVRIVDEISKALPDWVWLTEASYDGQKVTLKGNALSNNLIADYILALENSPYFNNVNIISSTQRTTQQNQYLEFSLTANVEVPTVPKTPQETSSKAIKGGNT